MRKTNTVIVKETARKIETTSLPLVDIVPIARIEMIDHVVETEIVIENVKRKESIDAVTHAGKKSKKKAMNQYQLPQSRKMNPRHGSSPLFQQRMVSKSEVPRLGEDHKNNNLSQHPPSRQAHAVTARKKRLARNTPRHLVINTRTSAQAAIAVTTLLHPNQRPNPHRQHLQPQLIHTL